MMVVYISKVSRFSEALALLPKVIQPFQGPCFAGGQQESGS